jgi:hypothetical protein
MLAFAMAFATVIQGDDDGDEDTAVLVAHTQQKDATRILYPAGNV